MKINGFFLHNFFAFVQYILGEKMKKVILIILVLFVLVGIYKNDEMIRIRVLANSNSEYDQKVKGEVVEIVKEEFKKILKDTRDVNDARKEISSNLENISSKVDRYLIANKVNYKSEINYGLNYFPIKEYNGKSYEEGYYESVLITLGNGDGDNWWCILFPTVCLSNDDVKYESLVKNILERILK